MKRRFFLRNVSIAGVGAPLLFSMNKSEILSKPDRIKESAPICVATWNVYQAGKKAGNLLAKGSPALDAVEKGVMVEEANLNNTTVGKGGAPDRDGEVTLDACIMGPAGNCGSVAFLKNIEHPVAVARKVMEMTPHTMLVGEGAYKFALQQGFKSTKLLTEKAKKLWKEWLKEKEYKPIINIENHDTIGMLCLDKNGEIAGACSTSGLAYKMNGRVGDSPIIGSGLFVDNEIGGAVATGLGEEIIKNVSSFLVVELMRQGKSPQEACEEAINRIMKNSKNHKDFQVGVLALSVTGEVGAFSIHKGFTYIQNTDNRTINNKSKSYME